MKYLLKVVRIGYEKRNEIAWNINENPMKVHWTTNEISIESSKD